jgi:hypothetical protein
LDLAAADSSSSEAWARRAAVAGSLDLAAVGPVVLRAVLRVGRTAGWMSVRSVGLAGGFDLRADEQNLTRRPPARSPAGVVFGTRARLT